MAETRTTADPAIAPPRGGRPARSAWPVKVSEFSFPEPDVSIVRGSNRDDQDRHPAASDVLVVVEVADETLDFDSGENLDAYAAASLPCYWVVNIPDGRIDVYTGPSGPAASPTYEGHRGYEAGDEVPVVLDGREVGRVAVADVLP